jgi:5-methylcytosine-specific restriction endonuclease McrA
MPAALGSLPAEAPRGALRDRLNAYRAWYKTARWQALRWAVLVRDLFTCQMCGRVEPNSSQLVADHRKPHRGDAALFWDETNLWTLCKTPCHDSVKQREENAARRPVDEGGGGSKVGRRPAA